MPGRAILAVTYKTHRSFASADNAHGSSRCPLNVGSMAALAVNCGPPAGQSGETMSLVSRPRLTASASAEQPAFCLFPKEMSLMEAVVDPVNIERAWKQVTANRGTPGPNGITITEFRD